MDAILRLVQALTMFDTLESPVRPCSDLFATAFISLSPKPPILLADTDAQQPMSISMDDAV